MPTTLSISSVTATHAGTSSTLGVGAVLDLTLATTLSIDQVTLAAGGTAPTLTLSNGASATYTSHDATGLHFAYTVATGQDIADLQVTGLVLNGATFAHSPTTGFATHQDYATGRAPTAVTSGDVNSDGKQDLLVANYSDNTVSVLLGNGDGTFAPKQDFSIGGKSFAMTLADLNGDGKQDLIVADYSTNAVSVLLGNGDGTFAPKQDFATGGTTYAMTLADLNGDGKQDVVVANQFANTVSVLLGNGNGTFGPKQDFATGTTPDGVAVADVNGDGKQDLVAANVQDNTVSVLLGNGDGTFGPKQDFVTGSGPVSVTIADVNGDGKRDLLVTNTGVNTVSVLLGNGDGTFGPKQDFVTGSGPNAVALADINGDGKADLVVENQYGNSVSVLPGNGDGTFGPKQDFATGRTPSAMTSADLNGDGLVDVVTANQNDNKVSVLLGSATAGQQLAATALAGATGLDTHLAVDTTAPAAPAVTGLLGGGTRTHNTTPVLTITAEHGATVKVYDGGLLAGTALETPTPGTFTFVPSSSLTEGVHTFTAKATDAAGNVSTLSASQSITVDTTAPTATVTAPSTTAVNTTSLTYTVAFSEAVTGVTANAFTLHDDQGHTLHGTVGTPTSTDGGLTYTVAVTGLAGTGVVHLDLNGLGTGIADTAGNAITSGATGTSVTLTQVAPSAPSIPVAPPTITTVDGSSAHTGQTLMGTLATAAAGQSVVIKNGDSTLATVTTDAQGHFSLPLTFDGDGPTHTYTLTATTVGTNGAASTSQPFTYTVDFTPNQTQFGSLTHDVTSDAGGVYALYQALLGRAPDAMGMESFTNAMQHGDSLTDVANAILASTERAGANSDPTAYVQSLYTNLLHRDADANGLQFFTAELGKGMSQAQVAAQIATSTEAQGSLAATFQSGVYVPDASEANVARLYFGLLGRAPDGKGLSSLSAYVEKGPGGPIAEAARLGEIAKMMLQSSEFLASHAGQSDTGFVDSLYTGAIGRHADAGGTAYWTDQLAHGVDRATVALGIAESAEAQAYHAGHIETGWHLVS